MNYNSGQKNDCFYCSKTPGFGRHLKGLQNILARNLLFSKTEKKIHRELSVS